MVSLVTEKIKVEERRWSSDEPNGTQTFQVRPRRRRPKRKWTKNSDEKEQSRQTLVS